MGTVKLQEFEAVCCRAKISLSTGEVTDRRGNGIDTF